MYKISIMKMTIPQPVTLVIYATSLPEARKVAAEAVEMPDAVGYRIEDDAGNIIEKWGAS